MSFKRVLLTVGVLALAAGRADAAFTTYRAPIRDGAFAGLYRTNLILFGDWSNDSITIAAVSIETTSYHPGSHALKFHVPSSANPDVYAPTDVPDVLADSFNPGDRGSFAGLAGGINVATPEPNAASKSAYDAGLDSYEVIAFYRTPFAISRAEAPAGIVIASAVVPSGEYVSFQGFIDNDLDEANGYMPIYAFDAPIPEPAGLAGLGVLGAALLGRRRRREIDHRSPVNRPVVDHSLGTLARTGPTGFVTCSGPMRRSAAEDAMP